MKRCLTKLIKKELKRGHVVLLIGQRQVGKTYELKRYLKEKKVFLIDLEDEAIRNIFDVASISTLENYFGTKDKSKKILFDEIQYLEKSGSILKLLHDHFEKSEIVAIGSASFLMLKNIVDSLYGRSRIITMLPLSFREIIEDADNHNFNLGNYNKISKKPNIDAVLHDYMIFGSLPAVHLEKDHNEKKKLLKGYTDSLLFKDIFEIEGIRKPQVFKKLLTLLALQIGSEVNTNEIARQLGVSRNTVNEYIELYEKFQIVYRLDSYSTNSRKEISKNFKIYFVDTGIRNAIIDNFALPMSRTDKGDLFENVVMNVFRINKLYFNLDYQMFFWRNYIHSEVDLVLSFDNGLELVPIEIKYAKHKMPSHSFMNMYGKNIKDKYCINKDNLWKFV